MVWVSVFVVRVPQCLSMASWHGLGSLVSVRETPYRGVTARFEHYKTEKRGAIEAGLYAFGQLFPMQGHHADVAVLIRLSLLLLFFFLSLFEWLS